MTDSIRDYVESAKQKDLISQLLKQSFISIPPEYYEEMTELILEKLRTTNAVRKFISEKNKDIIEETARINEVTENAVIDSFVYFFLIVENVLLAKQVEELKKRSL